MFLLAVITSGSITCLSDGFLACVFHAAQHIFSAAILAYRPPEVRQSLQSTEVADIEELLVDEPDVLDGLNLFMPVIRSK